MNAIGMALVWCVVQVTLLAGVAALVYGLVRRSGPPARALAAFSGLVLIAALTALTFSPWPNWQPFESQATADAAHANPDRTGIEATRADSEPADAAMIGTATTTSGSADAVSPASEFFKTLFAEMQQLPVAEKTTWGWPAYVAALFLIGAGVGVVRLAAGLFSVRTYRRHAHRITDSGLLETADILLAELQGPKTIAICESNLLATPATIGWWRPLIILPADWKNWTEGECRAVLAHEMAHIVRHDFPTWVAAQVALVFHFYHPLVHWLAARLRLEQELAADATAAQLVGGQESYLATLAAMALRQSDRPLAWPARTFLPTRGTFMRRIEMLRDEKLLSTKMTSGLRAGLVAVLAVASLAVAGLRGTAADRKSARDEPAALAVADDAKTATSGSSQATGTSGSSSGDTAGDLESLAWVPRDAVAVVRIRPAELLKRPALAALKQALAQQKEIQAALGASFDKIEQVTIVFLMESGQPGRPGGPAPAGLIVRLTDDDDSAAVIKALQPTPEKTEYSGQTYIRGTEGKGPFCLNAGGRTVVVTEREEHLRRLIIAGKNGASKAKWADVWKRANSADVAALVNTAALREMMNQSKDGAVMAFAPLWQATSTALVTANLREKLGLALSLSADNANDAKKVRDTLAALVTLAQNSLSQAREPLSQMPGNEGAMLLRAADTADALLDSLKIEQLDDHRVQAAGAIEANEAATLAAMLVPAVTQARVAARRAQATNNLKQLALAMHNYADVNRSFPPAVLYGPDGKTPYSWRVALLPYLEQAPLYQQYKFDEPWDSANNKLVLAKMPAVFRDPNDPADSTFSSYYGLTGPATIFFGKEGAKFVQITDGTSNTLMFVEAKREIPWTKPEDIPYDKEKPLPKLGGHYPDGFIAAFCDGSVRFMTQNFSQTVLRAMMTRDGGEVVNLDDPLADGPPRRRPVPTPPPPLKREE